MELRTFTLRCDNPTCPYPRGFSNFLRPRNEGVRLEGRWYCSVECFEQAVAEMLEQLLRSRQTEPERRHRMPLGLLLLGRGVINENQLKEALQAQRRSGTQRLGYWLVEMGSVSHHDVALALATQWGCPYYPLDDAPQFRQCSQMIPLVLVESLRMLPVHYLSGSRLLFLGFSEQVDRSSMVAIEQVLGQRTEPCIVTDAAMRKALDEIRVASRPSEVVFDAHSDAYEMAHVICDYCLKFVAQEMRIARSGEYIWARLTASGQNWDLLFRLQPVLEAQIVRTRP